MATKKQPSRKQLAARKKFVAMVKARAKLAATAKRKAGYKLRAGKWIAPKVKRAATKRPAAKRRNAETRSSAHPVSVRRNGVVKKLYGAAAAAVLAARKAAGGKKANPKKRSTLLSGRKRNGWLGSQIKSAVSKRLHAPIRLRRKRNNSTPADISAMHEKFLGRPTEGHFEITAPQGTPKDVAVLGNLVCLKTENEEFEFSKGEAYLGADGRGNLYVLGDTTPVETNTNFGVIEEIRYEAKKDHLNPFRWRRHKSRRNSGLVEYFHFFGESDGVMPKLKSDGDGLLHISGGNYKVEAEGIIN